jgi:hypothetical protein
LAADGKFFKSDFVLSSAEMIFAIRRVWLTFVQTSLPGLTRHRMQGGWGMDPQVTRKEVDQLDRNTFQQSNPVITSLESCVTPITIAVTDIEQVADRRHVGVHVGSIQPEAPGCTKNMVINA